MSYQTKNRTAARPARTPSELTNLGGFPERRKPDAATARKNFMAAMSKAANSVTIVTTDGPGGRYGLTVSAVSSVSADPPLLLACINRSSPLCHAIDANQAFSVNLLSARQQRLASAFAGFLTPSENYDFRLASWHRGTTGTPGLANAAAVFECRLAKVVAAGSHKIFIGKVLDSHSSEATTLLYNNRRFGIALTWSATTGNFTGEQGSTGYQDFATNHPQTHFK